MRWELRCRLLSAGRVVPAVFLLFLVAGTAGAQTPSKTVGEASSSCGFVFLPSHLNDPVTQAGGSMRIPVRALRGCEIQDHVDVAFQYTFGLFSNAGIMSGPSFAVSNLPKTQKGFGREFGPVRLTRLGVGQPGEIVFEVVLVPFLFPTTTGSDSIVWTRFLVDGEVDLVGDIPNPILTTRVTPSLPVLGAPTISDVSVEVGWFPNPAIEAVEAFQAVLAKSSLEIATQTLASGTVNAVFEGLEDGTEYEVRLTARNSAGMSNPATVTFTTSFTSATEAVFTGLARDWDPGREPPRTLQEAIPSPVDENLDGVVNAVDAIGVLDRR